MRRKATIIGILAILLTAATFGNSDTYVRTVSSVRSFQRNFCELRKADKMNAIERFVFSLILANSKAPATVSDTSTPVAGRT